MTEKRGRRFINFSHELIEDLCRSGGDFHVSVGEGLPRDATIVGCEYVAGGWVRFFFESAEWTPHTLGLVPAIDGVVWRRVDCIKIVSKEDDEVDVGELVRRLDGQ